MSPALGLIQHACDGVTTQLDKVPYSSNVSWYERGDQLEMEKQRRLNDKGNAENSLVTQNTKTILFQLTYSRDKEKLNMS